MSNVPFSIVRHPFESGQGVTLRRGHCALDSLSTISLLAQSVTRMFEIYPFQESLYARQKDMAQKLRTALADLPPPKAQSAEGSGVCGDDFSETSPSGKSLSIFVLITSRKSLLNRSAVLCLEPWTLICTRNIKSSWEVVASWGLNEESHVGDMIFKKYT